MAAPHQYHQPNAPDDDSDLDLDLEELDPLAANSRPDTSPPPRPSKEQRKPYQELGARIPLRNLRVGRLRRQKPRQSEEEDLRGLIDDDDTAGRDSNGSFGQSGDDDAPLLPSHGRQRRHSRVPSALSRFQSNIRLPSFLGVNSPNRTGIQIGCRRRTRSYDPAHHCRWTNPNRALSRECRF
jgi:phospholipid-translocating ATPase